jgi:hypothetical protein
MKAATDVDAAMRAYDQGDDPGRSGRAAVWGALRSRTKRSNAPRTCESDEKGKDDAQGSTVGADHDLPVRMWRRSSPATTAPCNFWTGGLYSPSDVEGEFSEVRTAPVQPVMPRPYCPPACVKMLGMYRAGALRGSGLSPQLNRKRIASRYKKITIDFVIACAVV